MMTVAATETTNAMGGVLEEIIQLLTSGISGIAQGIGDGLGDLVESIFLKVDSNGAVTGLSTFGGVIIIFAGVSLAIGLSKLVVNWVSGLGGGM